MNVGEILCISIYIYGLTEAPLQYISNVFHLLEGELREARGVKVKYYAPPFSGAGFHF